MATTENHDQPGMTGEVKPTTHAADATPTTVQSKEPEDAYLTGGQRNLQRRVLGLNVEGKPSQNPPKPAAGLHSTGSFTGVANPEDGQDGKN